MSKQPQPRTVLTRFAAAILVDAFEIDRTLDSKEEVEALQDNNPELLQAMRALYRIAEPRAAPESVSGREEK